MTGRMGLLAFVAASGAVHGLPGLPGLAHGLAAVALAVLLSLLVLGLPQRVRAGIWALLWAGLAGFWLTVVRADHRLADALAEHNENKVSRVVLRVAGLPRLGPEGRQFQAQVLSSLPEGVPTRIQVSWPLAAWSGPYGRGRDAGGDAAPPASLPDGVPDIAPGQVWRMALSLKTPRGLRNPHAFDYEAYMFAQGVRATGSVRGTPHYLRDEPWASLPIAAQRARHAVRAAMLPHLEGKRYGAVLLALAIGDQASVEPSDWTVFNRTGITHLVSISGSHITMIAALGGALTYWLWRRLRWRGHALAERLPAQVAAALAALLVAWLYCLLAGWGVPARRTFLMLAVMAGAYVLRLPVCASRLLSLAAFAVVLMDPWALLASGFWLSFGAVYVLMTSSGWWGQPIGRAAPGRWRRAGILLARATRLQLAVTAALMPLLALIFHEVSLASPLANAYAIPVISLAVTPLALLSAGAAVVPGLDAMASGLAWLGHAALELMMAPTVWLSNWRAASFTVAAAPWWLTALALSGLVAAMLPYGLPGRRLAWLLMMPALCWPPKRPHEGEWTLHALDVGQAGAIVIQTARHAFLFDTGLRSGPDSDDGARVIRPFLHAQGIVKLDTLIVSHADIDHAGGLRSLLQAVPVQQSYSSFDLAGYLKREAALLGMPGQLPPLPLAMSPCQYGMTWHVDGVSFEFLWPLGNPDGPRAGNGSRRNAQACVLRLRGEHHSALLPADIGAAQEAALVDRGLGYVDVVLAPHHGSKSSSSPAFVNETQAWHVVAQAGAWNRYGHPNSDVQSRWQRSGAAFWRSDWHGAVTVHSSAGGLRATSARQASRRYWQTR
ncbi:DNA internalization-related competence protein ComEC/Rec2 [Pollutimonas sp. M17]|uniref:DNA internalization-related competence protein ComEC/Rec2 n=1 Tax=Pollutimonas sp. M17 TaxID=2962065 RepID=UPI002938F5A8|nr:DNA internalization-related competence protein ComEC/Rec2 [Pollutimonas sp. M17]